MVRGICAQVHLSATCVRGSREGQRAAEHRPQHSLVPSETPCERLWERSRPLANVSEGLLLTEWRKSSPGNDFWACGDAKQ